MSGKNEPKCPKGERAWVGYYNQSNELMFIVTSKETSRDYYFLYELVDGEFRKLGRSKSPKELEEKFEVDKKLRSSSTLRSPTHCGKISPKE